MQIRQLVILLSAQLAFLPAAFAQDWVEKSNEVTSTVLKAQGQFSPEGAASLGVASFDEGITDLNEGVFERSQAENERLLKMVEERKKTAEHPKLIQDLEILSQSLTDGIESANLQRQYMLPYYNLPQSLFFGFRSILDPRVEPERHAAALVRLRKYTGSEDGYTPLTELAIARTRERLADPTLVGPFEGELTRDLNNVPRFAEGTRQLFEASGLEGWEDDLALLEQQLNDYAEFVKAEISPRARTDSRLPEAIYADNLKGFGVRANPEDLIRMAQFSYQEIRSQMKSVARQIAEQRGWENSDLMSVMSELKKDQIPEGKIIEVYKDRLAVIEEIIEREQIVTLPQREASIRLATEAESSSIPAPFMSPPQLINNTGQYGEFVLVQKNPSLEGDAAKMDDWNHDAVTWALTVHEARPGHEMQFAALVENGTSQARAIYAFNSANVEGWGLYSEAIMMEHLPLEGQLFTLLARLQRAGRMFMDPMINLGLITREETVALMREQIGISEAMANSEADRYSFRAPGQATSYFYGFMNLQRLRTETEIKLGQRFNQRAFHDFILAQGLLPPDLLRQAVLEEFVPSQ